MTLRSKALLFLATCGLLLNGLLLFWKLQGTHDIAGCGGAGCDMVMASRWSMLGPIPVAAPGIAIYAVLLVALIGKRNVVAIGCGTAIAGAAAWFISLQAIVIGSFCGWCLATHAIGMGVACMVLWDEWKNPSLLPSAGVGALAVMGLAATQFLAPAPTHIVAEARQADAVKGDVHAEGQGRSVAFDDGHKVFNADALPSIGKPSATHVLVEYFDYRCPACRTMSGYLAALVAKHPDEVKILLLPVPLEHGCNRYLPADDPGHERSCELARAALALWRAKPDAFATAHAAMFGGDPAVALEVARKALAPASLENAMQDPWIIRVIDADVSDWHALSSRTRHLPKLLISGKRILHGLPGGEAEFMAAMEKELGL